MNTGNPQSTKRSDSSLGLVKEICSKVTEAIEEIQEICDEEEDPQIDLNAATLFQGIGLYVFVQEQEKQIREKYPAFNDNEVLNIVVAQWETMSGEEKLIYSNKIKPEKVEKSKKLKKINKMMEKALDTIHNQSSNDKIIQEETGKIQQRIPISQHEQKPEYFKEQGEKNQLCSQKHPPSSPILGQEKQQPIQQAQQLSILLNSDEAMLPDELPLEKKATQISLKAADKAPEEASKPASKQENIDDVPDGRGECVNNTQEAPEIFQQIGKNDHIDEDTGKKAQLKKLCEEKDVRTDKSLEKQKISEQAELLLQKDEQNNPIVKQSGILCESQGKEPKEDCLEKQKAQILEQKDEGNDGALIPQLESEVPSGSKEKSD